MGRSISFYLVVCISLVLIMASSGYGLERRSQVRSEAEANTTTAVGATRAEPTGASLEDEGCGGDSDADASDESSQSPGVGCTQQLPHEPASPHGSRSTLSRSTWENRQRKKQIHILLLQSRIMDFVGPRRASSTTPNNLTNSDYERFEALMRRAEQLNPERPLVQQEYMRRYQAMMPICTGPRNSDRSCWEDGSAFRLFFVVDSTESARNRQIRILSAYLKLKMKPIPDVLVNGRSHATNVSSGSQGRQRRRQTSSLEAEDQVERTHPESESDVKLTIFQYTRLVRRNRNDAKTSFKTLTIPRNSGGGWARINIKGLVEDWQRRPNRNFGLQLVVKNNRNQDLDPYEVFERMDCDSSSQGSPLSIQLPLTVLEESIGQDLNDTLVSDSNMTNPYLELVSTEVSQPRNVRHQRDLSYNKRPTCAIEKISVSFAELGYSDRIVQPKGFVTGFCKGSCSFLPVLSNLKNGPSGVNNAASEREISEHKCCGVTKVKPLSILHYDDAGKLSISVIDDIIVTECGCRP